MPDLSPEVRAEAIEAAKGVLWSRDEESAPRVVDAVAAVVLPAQVDALEAENERLREENERLNARGENLADCGICKREVFIYANRTCEKHRDKDQIPW